MTPTPRERSATLQHTHEGSSIDSGTAGIRESGQIGPVLSSLSAVERETTVTATDADDTVRIWTCQKRYLGRLRRHPSFTEVATGFHGSTEWAEFTIAAADWNPATGAKRKVTMTDERKAALADRMRSAREARA